MYSTQYWKDLVKGMKREEERREEKRGEGRREKGEERRGEKRREGRGGVISITPQSSYSYNHAGHQAQYTRLYTRRQGGW